VQIDRLETRKVEVDVDALMARYGVSGFEVLDAGLNEQRDMLSTYATVHFDGDDDETDRWIIAEPGEMGNCHLTDTDGGDLTDAEEEFFLHLADISVGYREA
jgi:hypothetical protein